MSDPEGGAAPKSATQVLADLVARRKAASQASAKGFSPDRKAEKVAAAHSASKSKPAMKKP